MRIGDMVECIDNTSVSKALTIGKRYVVRDFDALHNPRVINDNGIFGTYKPNRFKLVPNQNSLINPFKPKDRIVCIDNDAFPASLTVGKTYYVMTPNLFTRISQVRIEADNGIHSSFNYTRFKYADENKFIPNQCKHERWELKPLFTTSYKRCVGCGTDLGKA